MSRVGNSSVQDWLDVHDLFVRYAGGLDDGDVETVVACFGEDASLESPLVGAFVGRAAIREFATRMARLKTEGGVQLRHVISNLSVQTDGDRARATCYLLPFATRDGKSEMLPPSQYDCTLQRVAGRWLFERRIVRADHPYSIPEL